MKRPSLLYVVHRLPYPPDKGDRIRSFNLLKHLSRFAEVHLACFTDEPEADGAVNALRTCCERVAVIRLGWQRWVRAAGSFARGRSVSEGAFHSAHMREVLRSWARETRFTASIASASSIARHLQIPELGDVPAVIDLVDLDSQKWLDYAAAGAGPRSWFYRTEGSRVRRMEQGVADWAAACTLVSEAEADLCRRHCTGGAIHSVLNGVDLDYFRPSAPVSDPGCVFVGALDYRPNVDAARWFCSRMWPHIRALYPTSAMQLVGRRPVQAVRALSRIPGVEVIGGVPDVRPYLERAAVVVAPLRIARGVQNKVLEALAMGKALLASPQALTGLDVEPGVHVLSATREDEWIAALCRLFDGAPLRRRLGVNGRLYVEEHHRWDRCLEPFESLLGLSVAVREGVVCAS